MYKAIIKIDACGSKEFVSSSRCLDSQSMRELLFKKIAEIAKEVYPDSDTPFPDGSIYSGQGDCVYVFLDNPDYAIRATIDFQKKWYECISEYPDCRAVIDYDDLRISDSIPRTEALSEALENVNIIEKNAGNGEILITKKVYELLRTKNAYRFTESSTVEIKQRIISTYKVDYDNPRTINDDYLVQTIFIADEKSELFRDRSINLLALNCIIARNCNVKICELIEYIQEKENIEIDSEKLTRIIQKSSLLSINKDYVFIDDLAMLKIDSIRDSFNNSKNECIDFVANDIGSIIGIDKKYLIESINLAEMIERYLINVFNEIKLVAYFYNERTSFYEKLKDISEFDSSLKREYEIIRNLTKEDFILFKESFLVALSKLTLKNNIYIASIFHNILSNYYLNRNDKYLQSQIRKLKNKKYYLDTNVFYSYRVRSSIFNGITKYVINKLIAFGASICIFDKSVNEYNNSIRAALHSYQKNNNRFISNGYLSWIAHEYNSHSEDYKFDFEYCVKLHEIETNDDFEEQKRLLHDKYSISLEYLNPYHSKTELGILYDQVYKVKSQNKPLESLYYRNLDLFDEKVLHDANCINFLKQNVNDPSEADSLFITCDFRLASIRKRLGIPSNYILTIEEIYEFLLPYLLINENLVSNPITIPNLLLASAIDIELGMSETIESVVGSYLAKSSIPQDYKLLHSIKQRNRFDSISKRIEITKKANDNDGFIALENELDQAKSDYKKDVAEHLVKTLTAGELEKKDKEIANLTEKITVLEQNIQTNEKRNVGYKRYKRKVLKKRKSKKSK